jgi:UDP-glucose:(heptosyl)LPS alpha-1,3-glucosyltransferase
MSQAKLTIGFVRRGFSASGGAEAYLQRLAKGVVARGHEARLFTTVDWPEKEWSFGQITRLRGTSPIGFANELEKLRWQVRCDVLMSLERVWSCDVYRAGDGVHRAWLDRRKKFEPPLQRIFRRFNRKHEGLLRLERSLLDERKAERVIVNSQMVKREIFDLYCYRPDKIDVIPNGVPIDEFRFDPERRAKSRADLRLQIDEIVALFVGSGWERKGLRFAIEAVESLGNPKMRLLVVGRGTQDRYKSTRVQFLEEMADLRLIYAAADIFILPTIYDPFSNACLEALAAGLPVITTRDNGFSEIMEDRIHGVVVDHANNVVDLRNALEIWSDATRRSAARSSILKRASQFDISRNIEKTLEILTQFATSAASTSRKIRNT